jgi:hypothetical protein
MTPVTVGVAAAALQRPEADPAADPALAEAELRSISLAVGAAGELWYFGHDPASLDDERVWCLGHLAPGSDIELFRGPSTLASGAGAGGEPCPLMGCSVLIIPAPTGAGAGTAGRRGSAFGLGSAARASGGSATQLRLSSFSPPRRPVEHTPSRAAAASSPGPSPAAWTPGGDGIGRSGNGVAWPAAEWTLGGTAAAQKTEEGGGGAAQVLELYSWFPRDMENLMDTVRSALRSSGGGRRNSIAGGARRAIESWAEETLSTMADPVALLAAKEDSDSTSNSVKAASEEFGTGEGDTLFFKGSA